jgi:anti-sigma factor RsiW
MNSASDKTASDREPSEVELLLPWHAAGMLTEREAQAVEAALASDPELAQRYEWVREELGQETHLSEALGEPSTGDVKALFAKIDAEPARPRLAAAGFAGRVGDFLTSLTPRTLAWSAMAAALVIALQAGLIGGVVFKTNGAGYQTASVSDTANDGADLLIRFQPQASAADVTSLLEANTLSIVGGPSSGGLFRVRVGSTKPSKAALIQTVKTLQDNKVVGFVAATE